MDKRFLQGRITQFDVKRGTRSERNQFADTVGYLRGWERLTGKLVARNNRGLRTFVVSKCIVAKRQRGEDFLYSLERVVSSVKFSATWKKEDCNYVKEIRTSIQEWTNNILPF